MSKFTKTRYAFIISTGAMIALLLFMFFYFTRDEEVIKLSPEPTVGVVFVQPGRARKFYPKGNPDALPVLHRIFENEDLKYVWGNTARVIGYVGGPEDVEKLKKVIDRLDGDLHRDVLYGIFEAWAVMSRRGISEADDAIREWCTFEKWDDEFGDLPKADKYEHTWLAIYIYGIYGDINWQHLRDKLLEGIEDQAIKGRIKGYLSDHSMTRAIEQRKEREKARVLLSEQEKLEIFYANKKKYFEELEFD